MSESQTPKNAATADASPKTTLGVHLEPEVTLPFCASQAKKELGQFGKYRILKLLGVGGMGAVYQAEDTVLHRKVAVKILLPELNNRAEARSRFLREAQAVAALSHDHIIAIHEVHECDGLPFLVMPLLSGETLQSQLRRDGALPIPLSIRYGREIAEALSAAHAAGIVHRDIKPSNIFLERFVRSGEEHVRVKILDFGLARPIEGAEVVTLEGVIVGTPAYMAPEQARGDLVDERSDLFSLGSVLYEMCTGKRAFAGNSSMAVLTALATQTPAPASRLNPAVPVWLADLISELLQKQREDRPKSSALIAAKLASHESSGDPPMPREHGPRQQSEVLPLDEEIATQRAIERLPRRSSRIAIWGVIGVLVFAAATGGGWYALRKSGGQAGPQPNAGPLDVPPVAGTPLQLKSWHPKELVAIAGDERQRHWGPVTGMSLNEHLATCATGDPWVRLWNPMNLDPTEALPLPHPNAMCVTYSANGRWLACGLEDGRILVWDRSVPQQPAREVACPGDACACNAIAFTTDETTIYAIYGQISLARVRVGADNWKATLFPKSKDAPTIYCFAVAPNQTRLIAGDLKGLLHLWDVSKDSPILIKTWKAHAQGVRALAFGHHEQDFWSGGDDGQVFRWTLDEQDVGPPRKLDCPITEGREFPHEIQSITVSRTTNMIVVSDGWNYHVFDTTGDPPKHITSDSHGMSRRAQTQIYMDGRSIYSGDEFGRVRRRRRDGDLYLPADDIPVQGYRALTVSPTTGDIATIWGDCKLSLWRFEELGARQLAVSEPCGSLPFGLARNGDGTLLASAENYPQTIRMWSVVNNRLTLLDSLESRADFSIALVPKGNLIVAGTHETGFFRIGWDGSKLKLIDRKQGDPDTAMCMLSLSSSGNRLATCGQAGHVHIWDADGEKLTQIKHFETIGTIQEIAIHPDGNALITASRYGGTRFFDLREKVDMGLELTQADSQCVAFDKTGERFACGMPDGRVVVWATNSKKEMQNWKLSGQVVRVAFSPDGNLLYSLNGNGTIYALRLLR